MLVVAVVSPDPVVELVEDFAVVEVVEDFAVVEVVDDFAVVEVVDGLRVVEVVEDRVVDDVDDDELADVTVVDDEELLVDDELDAVASVISMLRCPSFDSEFPSLTTKLNPSTSTPDGAW